MIISCPQCSSEFILHLDKIPPAKFLQGHGYGWVMACSDCRHRWWYKNEKHSDTLPPQTEMSISPIPDDFEDLTNLDGLKKIKARSPIVAEDLLTKSALYQSAAPELSPSAIHNAEPILDIETRRLRSEPRPKKPGLSKALIFFWFFFIFLAGVLIATFFIYKGQISAIWNQSTPSTVISPASVTPLALQNVKYVSQSNGGGLNYLNVMGEIVNNNSTSIALRPLKIIVWAQCPPIDTQGSISASANQAPVKCVKAEWSHTWERPHILPGERLWFQTGTSLAADIKIERVDVTLP